MCSLPKPETIRTLLYNKDASCCFLTNLKEEQIIYRGVITFTALYVQNQFLYILSTLGIII